jgi:hypothetical protein
MSNYECLHCDKTIENIDELVYDDAGEYHEDCHDDYNLQESAYWLAWYNGEKIRRGAAHAPSNDGYDWGDPKNSDYIEHILDNA